MIFVTLVAFVVAAVGPSQSSPLLQIERPQRVTRADNDVLLVIEQVRDGRVAHRRVQPRIPERVSGGGVQRDQIALRAADEEHRFHNLIRERRRLGLHG